MRNGIERNGPGRTDHVWCHHRGGTAYCVGYCLVGSLDGGQMSKNMRSLLLVLVHALLGIGIARSYIMGELVIGGLCFGLMVGIVNVTLLYKEKP